jgi:alpha-amylase
MFKKATIVSMASLGLAAAGDKNFWKSKTVYQLLTDRFSKDTQGGDKCTDLSNYCGGTWKGIENNLDYIKGMGFDAIWISPIVDNIGNNYHGYAARNWEKRNDHFGSDDDLKSLVKAAHAKGIAVMVDVVANHSGPVGDDFS